MLVSDGAKLPPGFTAALTGLNPCFSGCWSRTGFSNDTSRNKEGVLILVLVDVGLGQY